MVKRRKKKVGSDLSQLLYYTVAFSDGPTTVKSTFSAQKYPCLVKLAFPHPQLSTLQKEPPCCPRVAWKRTESTSEDTMTGSFIQLPQL